VTVLDLAPPDDNELADLDTPRGRASRQVALAVQAMCPYLETQDGWRSVSASREHRCQAVPPGLRIPLDEQRRLCLKAIHTDCSRYLAARSAHALEGADGDPRPSALDAERNLWRFTKTGPATIDDGRIGVPIPIGRERTIPQAGLGVVMVAVVAILVATRFAGGADPGLPAPGSSATPPAAAAAGSPTPAPSPTASVPAPTPSSSQSPPPSRSPQASPTGEVAGATATAPVRSYRVRSGDTLYGIAVQFGTTVRAIQELNGIDDPSRLRVGQVLKIP
jgi:LysM repeat protein